MGSKNNKKRILIIIIFFITVFCVSIIQFKIDFVIGEKHYYVGIDNYLSSSTFSGIENAGKPFTINQTLSYYEQKDSIMVNDYESDAYIYIDEINLDGGFNFFYTTPYKEEVESLICESGEENHEYLYKYLSDYSDITALSIKGDLAVEVSEKEFEQLDKLETLEVESGSLDKINIDKFSSLENLSLRSNSFDSINDINGVEKLDTLDLTYNSIDTIEPTERPNKIEVLDLSYNDIKFIENIETYQNLMIIDLTGNEITRITQDSYDYIIDNDIKVIGIDIDDVKIGE